MKNKNCEVVDHGSHLDVTFSGFNVQDVFINSFKGFKRLVWQKNVNRPEPKVPIVPVMSYSIQIEEDNPETIFAQWFDRLLHHTESMQYLPLSLDVLYLSGNILKAKVSYRLLCKKDKCNYILKGIDAGSVNLESTDSGVKVNARIKL